LGNKVKWKVYKSKTTLKPITMKKFSFLITIFLLAGCTSTINSVIDPSHQTKKYESPMIAILYEYGSTYDFSSKLKQKLESHFYEDHKTIEIIMVENKKQELKIEDNNETQDRIYSYIEDNDKDLAIIIKPTSLHFVGYSLRYAEYEIIAFETRTNKVIWKSEFDFETLFGAYTVVDKVAEQIYSTLKSDHIL
jgi:hypothetical protein